MAEIKEVAKEIENPNISQTIVQTLIFLSPVFWLFYNIAIKRYDALLLCGCFAVLGTVLTTVVWYNYISALSKNKHHVKQRNRATVWIWPIMIITIVLAIFVILCLFSLFETIIVPNEFLFYELGPLYNILFPIVIILPAILISGILLSKLTKNPKKVEDSIEILYFWNRLGKRKIAAVFVWVIVVYFCLTNFTCVTENEIIKYSPLNPTGTEYSYSDVEHIETGFGDKTFTVFEYKRKGSFYYKITLDGKETVFHCPSINSDIERYSEDTYLELEEFDKKLVGLGISKESSSKGYENCDFDKEYVDRFLRIIELKE